VEAQREAVKARQISISQKLGDAQERIRTRLENRRTNWDENIEKRLEKFSQRAAGSEQEKAASEFSAAVRAAILAKRTAFDQALQNFHLQVAQLHQKRKEYSEQSMLSYQDAVGQAYEAAAGNCQNGGTLSSANEVLRQNLEKARQEYRQGISEMPAGSDEMKKLVEEKNEAIKKASEEFRQALKQALENLKSEFSELEDEIEEAEEKVENI